MRSVLPDALSVSLWCFVGHSACGFCRRLDLVDHLGANDGEVLFQRFDLGVADIYKRALDLLGLFWQEADASHKINFGLAQSHLLDGIGAVDCEVLV